MMSTFEYEFNEHSNRVHFTTYNSLQVFLLMLIIIAYFICRYCSK